MGTGEVFLRPKILEYEPREVFDMLRLAFEHCSDELLVEAACGGSGPFSEYFELTFEEYIALKAKFEADLVQERANAAAKRKHTTIRRQEFRTARAHLVLQMLDRGIPYVCSYPDCEERQDLTVDHILPISKGGTDDLKNLQFLCLRHNSQKGDGAQDQTS